MLLRTHLIKVSQLIQIERNLLRDFSNSICAISLIKFPPAQLTFRREIAFTRSRKYLRRCPRIIIRVALAACIRMRSGYDSSRIMSLAIRYISHEVVIQTVVHGSLRFDALFNVSRTRSLLDDLGFVSSAVCVAHLLLVTRLSLVSPLKTLSLDIPTYNERNSMRLINNDLKNKDLKKSRFQVEKL